MYEEGMPLASRLQETAKAMGRRIEKDRRNGHRVTGD